MNRNMERVERAQRWLATIIWLAVFGIVMAVLFGHEARAEILPVTAHQDPSCDPKTWKTPNGTGSDVREVWTSDGHGRAHWCPAEPPAGAASGVTYWRVYAWAGLYRYGWDAARAAIGRIQAASEPWTQAKAEARAGAVIAPAGSYEQCLHTNLMRAACADLWVRPLPGYPPAVAYNAASAAERCGPQAQCVAPAPAPAAYVVTNTTVYPITAAGTRGPSLPQKATLGQPCDCAAKQIANPFGGQFCAVTVPNVAQLVVAGCSLKR